MTPAAVMQEPHKGYRTSGAKFYKTIIRNNIGETISESNTNITEVKMLEIPKLPTMKSGENGDDFQIG